MKNKGGRPTKYPPDVLDQLADSLIEWVKKNYKANNFALLSDWAIANNFSPFYFNRFIGKHKKFKKAYYFAKSWQEHQIAKGALNKKYDPRFAQFFLGCQHGWRSKDDADQQKRELKNDFVKFMDHIKNDEEIELPEEEDDDEEFFL